MKTFFSSSKGNTVLGIILAIIIFVLLNAIFGLGGAIGGAIAGGGGFGLAALISSALKPKEEKEAEEEKGPEDSK